MTTVNVGKIRLNWKGSYSSTTTYHYNDAVFYDASSWVYINNSNSSGNTPSEGSTYWQLLAQGQSITGHGSILYGGANGNEVLSAGESGKYLQTRGVGNSPIWAEGTLPTYANLPSVLPYTHTASLTPTTNGSALASCSFDGSNSVFTCNGHGLHDGQRVRFVGESSSITTNSNFELDYTYYVTNKTTNTFQLSKTFTFSASPSGGAVVTGSTSVSDVTNLYKINLISDNWLGWDHTTQTSLIEGGLEQAHKLGPDMHNFFVHNKETMSFIDTNYVLRGQGYYASDSGGITGGAGGSYGTWDCGIYPGPASALGEDEKFVACGTAGYRFKWARTNKGNLYTWGDYHLTHGHVDYYGRNPRKIDFFEENNLFVLGCVGSPLSRDTSYDGNPSIYVICADKTSGFHNGMPRHERRILYAWGEGSQGELGLGDATDYATPQLVSSVPETCVQMMLCNENGYKSVLLVCEDTESSQEDGNMQLYFTGRNMHGNGLGNDSQINSFHKYVGQPQNASGSDVNFKNVAYINQHGHYHSTSYYNGKSGFITFSGKLVMMGRNGGSNGSIGIGSTDTWVYTWTQVNSASNVTFREVHFSPNTTIAMEGIPGTGHFGQTYGAWGQKAKIWGAGYGNQGQLLADNLQPTGTLTQLTITHTADSDLNDLHRTLQVIDFPDDGFTHICSPVQYSSDDWYTIDWNGNLLHFGVNQALSLAYTANARYPQLVSKSWGNITDYTTDEHKLGITNRYPVRLWGYTYQHFSQYHVITNDGKWYSGGESHDDYLNAPALRGDVKGLTERSSTW